MTITAIELEYFKGVSDRVRIDLKPITLLVGANSAGKSSVFHALMYLRNILVDGNPFARKLGLFPDHDLGGFRNLVHQHDTSKAVVLRIDIDRGLVRGHPSWPYVQGYADAENHEVEEQFDSRMRLTHEIENEIRSVWVEVTVAWEEATSGSRPRVIAYSVGINDELVGVIERPDAKKAAYISRLNFMHEVFQPTGHEEWLRSWGGPPTPETGTTRNEFEEQLREMISTDPTSDGTQRVQLRIGGSPDGSAVPGRVALRPHFKKGTYEPKFYDMMVGMLSQALVGPLELAYEELKNMRYLGPLRAIPPRDFGYEVFEKESDWANGLAGWSELINDYQRNGNECEVVGSYLGEYDIRVRRIRELDRDSVKHILDSETTITSEQLKELCSAIDEKSPARWKIELVDKRSGTAIEPRDVGVGVSQLLPVIVATRRAGFFCVEQPELHLHPKMQVELGQIFLEGWWGHQVESQFLIETHSEHLINRLTHRVREKKVDQNDIAVIFVGSRNGSVRFDRLRIDGDGDFIDDWPGGFFEESFREHFAGR